MGIQADFNDVTGLDNHNVFYFILFFYDRSVSNRKVRDINRRNPKGELNSFLVFMVVKKVRSCGSVFALSQGH